MFYEGLRLCEAGFVVFYVSGRLWGVHLYVFYEGLRLWGAHLYVFHVSGRLSGGRVSNQPKPTCEPRWFLQRKTFACVEGGGGGGGGGRGSICRVL